MWYSFHLILVLSLIEIFRCLCIQTSLRIETTDAQETDNVGVVVFGDDRAIVEGFSSSKILHYHPKAKFCFMLKGKAKAAMFRPCISFESSSDSPTPTTSYDKHHPSFSWEYRASRRCQVIVWNALVQLWTFLSERSCPGLRKPVRNQKYQSVDMW